ASLRSAALTNRRRRRPTRSPSLSRRRAAPPPGRRRDRGLPRWPPPRGRRERAVGGQSPSRSDRRVTSPSGGGLDRLRSSLHVPVADGGPASSLLQAPAYLLGDGNRPMVSAGAADGDRHVRLAFGFVFGEEEAD